MLKFSFSNLLIILVIAAFGGSSYGQTNQGSGDTLSGDSTDMGTVPPGAVTSYPDIEYGSKGNSAGGFLGLGLGFGQVKSTETGSSPGIATLFNIEPGYNFARDSWSRLELSLQLFSGVLTTRQKEGRLGKGTFSVGLGSLARIGYGFSLGKSLFGVFKFGAGPVMAKAEFEDDGVKGKSDTMTGIMAQLGYHFLMPANDTMDFTGGFSWSHVQFDVDEIDVDGDKFKVDRVFLLNIPQIELGARIKF
jgi:hypothetical protein